jgi:large subunit ribosomal protein L20
MPRVRKGAARRRKHKRVLRDARGYHGAASRRYRVALQETFRAGVMATRDRQRRKRDFRRLWITRITAACRQRGLTYSRFLHDLADADIHLNRKMLSEIAVADPAAFDAIVAAASGRAPAPPAEPPEKAPPAEAAEKPPEAPEAEPAEAEAPAAKPAAPKAARKTVRKTAKKAVKKAAKKTAKTATKKAAKKAKKKAKKASPDKDAGE